MKLLKTSFLSAIITFLRLAAGFVSVKVVAVITGPAGVALIGAFSNFLSVVLTFANGAINNGVVKYTAEYDQNDRKLRTLLSTALKISMGCSILVGFFLIVSAPLISKLIFTNTMFVNVVRVLGVTIIFYSLNSLLISILNGKGHIKDFTIVNAVGSVIGLVFTVVLVHKYKIVGALYSLVLAQTLVFFITLLLVSRNEWFSWAIFRAKFNRIAALKLSHFSLMAFVTAVTVPTSQIILRNMLINKFDIDQAGYWQSVVRISDAYLMIITTSLATYYLPKLSSLKKERDIHAEILNGFKMILPVVAIGCITVYILRFFIIELLYTKEFMQMEVLFLWQLVGDFLKITAWLLAYVMLAKAMTKAYVISEVIFSALYLILSYIFISRYGLIGVTYAFAANYAVYLMVMIIIFRKLLFLKNG
ncbi:O-antigen translocase [Pedobacter endophyticus]|uniref:O-antigen translocase n=1 Tax=Pedobacter endophyticus TaxID=2789740 RepID=A0A7U3Q4B6_9SPHI|nr:O-antigen translocase [Pedobacter endophyticus]QPH38349.1 O-antigen translocase [Pedobacter endophyticus]